jgi:hypothetical protein
MITIKSSDLVKIWDQVSNQVSNQVLNQARNHVLNHVLNQVSESSFGRLVRVNQNKITKGINNEN